MQDDPNIPEVFARDLKSRFAAPHVPTAVDEAILNAARMHLGRNRKRLFTWTSAAAAGVAIATTTILYLSNQSHPAASNQIAMDINHDQQINILDALALARNGANDRDVQALAMQAVKLEQNQ